MPEAFVDRHTVLQRRAGTKSGGEQRFSTAVFVRGEVERDLTFGSPLAWADAELKRFAGNLVAAEVSLTAGERLRVVSVHGPAWELSGAHLLSLGVPDDRLTASTELWVIQLLTSAIREQGEGVPWVFGGDFNSSPTFDTMWPGGPHGYEDALRQLAGAEFVECLSLAQGGLTPTFRNTAGRKVIHQIDHLFVSRAIVAGPWSCATGDPMRVFGEDLSDHLPIVAEFY